MNPSKISTGVHVGQLTVIEATPQRKSGYTVWRCQCDCGGEILLDIRTLQRGTVTDCGCKTKLKPGQRDITGQRFRLLTAQYPLPERDASGSTVWHCICDCGGEIDALLHQLTAGFRKSCGCLSHPPLKDYLGKRFSMLTVTGYAGKEDGQHLWCCKCDCGKETVVRQTNLQSGKTKSCGCLQEEQILENLKLCEGYVRYHSGSWQTALAPHQHQRRDRRLPEQAHRKMVRADHVQTKNVLSRCV